MAKIVYWLSGILVFYTYFGYLGICIILSKIFNKKVQKKEIYPVISIIVPCYNEEREIRRKLDNLLLLDYPKDKLQIMIASESTDRTNKIVLEYTDKNIELYEYKERQGKTALLYQTVPLAKGEIIVFSDANVILRLDSIKKIAANFYDERIGAVTCLLVVDNPRASSISWGESVYKKYETLLRESNSSIRRVLNPDGALFAIRKKLYNPINIKRGDDFELVIRVLLAGYDSVFEPEAISYEDSQVTTCAEKARKVRMISWFLRSAVTLISEMFFKLRFDLIIQIISHKILRWFTPYFFIAVFISNIFLFSNSFFYKLTAIAQCVLYILGLVGLYNSEIKNKKPSNLLIKIMHYFLMYNYAFLVGTLKGIFINNESGPWEKVRK